MKIQMTALAATIALTVSTGAMAIGDQANQQSSGGNTNPSTTFQGSRDTTDSLAGFNQGNAGDGSESIIYQNGSFNDATVNQSGDQWSRIQQDTDGHDATVTQSGDQNESTIYQRGNYAWWKDGNTATVTQRTDLNDSYVFQDGRSNIATVIQNTGDLNDSYIEQEGKFNEAEVNQNGSELDSDIIQTGYGYGGYDNDAIITQSGIGHDSYTYQHGSYNEVVVNQSGNEQHFSHKMQTGNNNEISVTQN